MSSHERVARIMMMTAVTCAVVTTSLVVRRELFTPAGAQAPKPREIEDWRQYVAENRIIGDPDAPVKLIVFADFQCPYCKQFAERTWPAVHEQFGDRVALVVQHFPLQSIHPYAYSAARAAECAADQGRFAEMHDALYAGQASFGEKEFAEFAEESGVPDLTRFTECFDAIEPVPAIEEGVRAAAELGLRGTPSLMVNELLVYTPPTQPEELWRIIEDRL